MYIRQKKKQNENKLMDTKQSRQAHFKIFNSTNPWHEPDRNVHPIDEMKQQSWQNSLNYFKHGDKNSFGKTFFLLFF